MLTSAVLDRALAFEWAVAETVADDVERVAQGTILRTPSLPAAWSVNALRVEGAQPDLTLAEAEAIAAANVPDVAFRHVMVEEEATAARLAADAEAAGWTVDHEVVMALTAAPAREVDTGRVREGDLEEVVDLMATWFEEEDLVPDNQTAAELRELSRREHSATPERRFIVDDPPGRPAAMTSLRERDRVCQVEDVYTLPDARGRGHGRALVTRAAAFARDDDHEVIFIVADAEGRPKDLYVSVGFEPVGHRAVLHRDLVAVSGETG